MGDPMIHNGASTTVPAAVSLVVVLREETNVVAFSNHNHCELG